MQQGALIFFIFFSVLFSSRKVASHRLMPLIDIETIVNLFVNEEES
jgi:hypothetical protein